MNLEIISENSEQRTHEPCLVPNSYPKFHYTKRRFSITSKCRHMHGVLNIDEIKKTNYTVLLYFARRTF
jgi:hypothetical protein